MDLFGWLRKKPVPRAAPAPLEQPIDFDRITPGRESWDATEDLDASNFPLAVVGESHHRCEFERLFGPRTPDGVWVTMDARLIPESANPHDANAVRVELDGCHVGHLSRSDAVRYRKRYKDASVTCRALIRGGWRRAGSEGDYGVSLGLKLE